MTLAHELGLVLAPLQASLFCETEGIISLHGIREFDKIGLMNGVH